MLAPQYSSTWWSWWKALQPAWRALSLSQDLRATGDFDWRQTDKGSRNGIFSVIVALGWWLLGVKNGSGAVDGCVTAMTDVAWVLDQMITSKVLQTVALGPLGKRLRGNDNVGRVKAKK